jgi:Raf kinase inhibitor-like YbhB/YbcL family protein
MSFSLSSAAFADGAPIPTRHDHDNGDLSPELTWTGTPDGTEEIVLLVDDPDAPMAGSFIHWVLVGRSASRTGLAEGETPAEATSGANGFGGPGYLGPAPPPGHGPHHYVFRLLALSEPISVPELATYEEVEAACRGKVLAEARLTGTFER